MLSVDVIRQVWENIVTSHKTGITFLSNWNAVKDDRTDLSYPVAFWGPLSTTLVPNAEVLSKTFSIDMLFLDQSRSDRPNSERDGHHARMDTIAEQCWTRFHDLYLVNNGTWQGVNVDLEVIGAPTFSPVYDEGTQMRTGVRMTANVRDIAAPDCVDPYFD